MLGLLAHAFHLLLLVGGLVGVAVLLFPQMQAAARSPRRTARLTTPGETHSRAPTARRGTPPPGVAWRSAAAWPPPERTPPCSRTTSRRPSWWVRSSSW